MRKTILATLVLCSVASAYQAQASSIITCDDRFGCTSARFRPDGVAGKRAGSHHQDDARPARRSRHRVDSSGNPVGMVTVSTAAGIDITVAPNFAAQMQGFIADVVASGYKPPRIKCYSLARSHVAHSLHFRGEACDFNQHGWGKTDRFMYRVAALAKKHGLRDGCSFGDCGHIDSGRGLARNVWPHVMASSSDPVTP